jgi:hypothetical protein
MLKIFLFCFPPQAEAGGSGGAAAPPYGRAAVKTRRLDFF